MKRALALLLVSLVLFSCSDKEASSDAVVSETNVETKTETEALSPEAERNAVADGLPEKNFNGRKFRVFSSAVNTEIPDSQNGDVVNDAAFERNRTVEERFNVKVASVVSGAAKWQDHVDASTKHILSGDDAFELDIPHIIGGPNMTLDGYYRDLYGIPYLDFEKPWWHSETVKEMTLLYRMYITSGSVTNMVSGSKVIFMNKDKLAANGIEEPSASVHEGAWTLDKLISLSKGVYSDLNGNSSRDTGDFYGYLGTPTHNGYLTSCEIPIIKKTGDSKVLEITVKCEKTVQFVEKIYSWYFETPGVMTLNKNDPESGVGKVDWVANLFSQGHSLFAFGFLSSAAKTLRYSDVEYGILPFPKWDEAQESYRTFVGSGLVAIPITITNDEFTGIILEALSAEGYKQMAPAYFETALKEKFTYDSESVNMLDIINESGCISFSYAYDNWEGFGHFSGTLFGNNPTKDFASYYASRIASAQKRLDTIIEAFKAEQK